MKSFLTPCLILLLGSYLAACSSDTAPSESASESKASKVAQVEPSAEVPIVPVVDHAQSNQQAKGVTIGAFLHGAGPDEVVTKAFERGMELAADANSTSGAKRTILNRSQAAPDDPSLKPLIASGAVPLVVYWETTDVAPVASVLKESNVIAVPVWNVTEKVARLGQNVFGFGYSTERTFADYAKFAGKNLKSYRFGMISSSAEPFATQSAAFIEETKSQGNTVVFDEKADSASADFAGLVTRAKKEKCDTIFAVLPSDALVAFVKAARAASFGGKILVGDSFFAADRAALGKDADGIYLVQAWSDDPDLKSKYAAKYGVDPDGVTLGAAALGYDLVKCLEEVGESPDSEKISYAWLSKPCEGLTGKTQFSGERIAQRQKRILTVKGDRFELAG